MPKHFQQRRKKLRSSIKQLSVSALLVTNIKNVKYLTGFSGSSAYLFVTPKSEILLSDTRYEEQLQSECTGLDVDIRDATSTLLDSVVRVAKSAKYNTIGFEAGSITKFDFDQLAKALVGFELVATNGLIEKHRAVKDAFEINAIRKSIAVNQKTFEVIRSQLRSDQTELNIAHNLEHQMRAFGAKCCAFDPIVGIGARAALPHGQPTDARISEAPFVLIDWGAEVNDYLSDLTRVIVTGKVRARFRKIYDTVLKAQLAAIKKIRPGATLKSVDTAARRVITNAGFGDQFGHGLGHSFGLEIHEKPFLSPASTVKLESGMVITVEPGIYIPEFAGVRIEDDVLVTPDGSEVLSDLPKQLDECTVDLVA